MGSERDISEMKSEIQRKLYEKPIPCESVTVVASHHDPNPDHNSVLSADDSDSSSENSDGNSEQREVVPSKIPVTAPRTEFPVPVTTQIEITIPAPPIKISAVPHIKVPVTVPQVVRQIEINSDSKENHQAPDSSSDDDIGRFVIRRRDGEMEMPASDSSEDIGSYELKSRETQIKTPQFNSDSDSSMDVKSYEFKRRDVHIKTQVFLSDSDSSVEVVGSEFKRTEAHIKTADSHSDSFEDSGSDVERYMILRRQPEVELSAQDSEGMSYDSEDIEIPTTPLRRRFRRRGISLRWRRNSLVILSLSLRRRLQFLAAKRRRNV